MKEENRGRLVVLVLNFVGCQGPVLHQEEVCDAIRKAAEKFSGMKRKLSFYPNDDGGMSTSGAYKEGELAVRTSSKRWAWGSVTVSSQEGSEKVARDFADALREQMRPSEYCYKEIRAAEVA